MVGVVGTALPDRVVFTADPDINGSNMDCNSIKEGTVVHLPVWVAGRAVSAWETYTPLWAMRNPAAAQSKISSDVTVQIDVVKNARLAEGMVGDG